MIARAGGLGRKEHFDPKNLDYLISDVVPLRDEDRKIALLAARAPVAGGPVKPLSVPRGPATSKYHWDAAWWGDQGDTPRCTAFALLHAMADGPVTHRGQNPAADPQEVYEAIVAQDRSEGRVYSGGATSLAMAKVAMARGWIGEYRWGYSLADFVAAIKVGPVLLGIDWYTGMDDPEAETAIIRAKGRYRGGHEIVANGADLDDGMARLKQSWGRANYGRNGHGYLPFDDLERLIADGGDVLLFRELKTVRAAA
jgi:hypothetical protein